MEEVLADEPEAFTDYGDFFHFFGFAKGGRLLAPLQRVDYFAPWRMFLRTFHNMYRRLRYTALSLTSLALS